MKENSTIKFLEKTQRQMKKRKQKKQNSFWARYGKRKNITERPNGLIKLKKELSELEARPRVNIHLGLMRATLKKAPDRDGIHGFWFKKLIDSATE